MPMTEESSSQTAVVESDEQRAEAPEVEEVLVEEISIDGMCGVY